MFVTFGRLIKLSLDSNGIIIIINNIIIIKFIIIIIIILIIINQLIPKDSRSCVTNNNWN